MIALYTVFVKCQFLNLDISYLNKYQLLLLNMLNINKSPMVYIGS